QQTQQPRRDKAELSDITAVAVTSFCALPTQTVSTIFCAVSRYDKTLAIYRLSRQDGEWKSGGGAESELKSPTMIYNTPKRVGCLTFANLAANGDNNNSDMVQVLISGDLAGDAYAYNLLEKGHRLLLGHTASMLTGVAVLEGSDRDSTSYACIATCDRDEKIRISRFPETYIIEGYLLGHTKFVTAIAPVPTHSSLLVSCGGDMTLRLWDWKTQQELCSISTTTTIGDNGSSKERLPTDISVSADGKYVAVTFDSSKILNVYKLNQESTPVSLSLVAAVECPSQPLVVSFDQNTTNRLLLLMTEPHYLTGYKVVDESGCARLSLEDHTAPLLALKKTTEKESISMPLTILEKDRQGNPVLAKENETRGLNFEQQPWKRVERVAIAREKQKKRTQRKRDKKKQKIS
ncbi:MAG: hypothetical protein SGILL_003659, partial [Bacillariaceae sp.]